MSVPKKRQTKSASRQRASHFALKKPAVHKCTHCGQSIRPHQACPKCGYYKGEKKVPVQGKISK